VSRLELRGLVKSYESAGEVVCAVDGVSLSVEPGEFVAVYGPSGSGKTTLLMMAAAIMRPDRGSVMFGEIEVSALSERESARYRREEVGVVFQSFHLMPGASALDNAALKLLARGLTLEEAREAARPWLERVGLSARLNHTPAEMSMGERQRVAIARALANEPRLLLADEPTGALDTATGEQILELLRQVREQRGMTILLVTNDDLAAAAADRILRLRDGRVEAEAVEPAGGRA
jgi:putative ABC transport system ATP-binding protein